MKLRTCAALLVVLVSSTSCGQPSARPLPTAPPKGVLIRFQRATLAVGVVAGPEGRERGLMFRKRIGRDNGLLFLFPEKVQGGFWMKNVTIPLGIAYMAWEGGETVLVKRVMKMEPCKEDPCPVYRPRVRYDAALEVNEGWFKEHGVKRGSVGEIIGNLPKPS
jgi:uncharacterized protein